MTSLLDAAQTAARLPYPALVREIAALLRDTNTKLTTFTPANAGTARPAIQGDVVVFDIATGERCLTVSHRYSPRLGCV